MAGLSSITLGIVILLIQLGLYIGAPVIYGSQAQQAQAEWTSYFFLLFGTMVALGVGMPLIKEPVSDLIYFSLLFVLTGIILLAVPFVLSGFTAEITAFSWIGFGLLDAMVKAFDEEAVFRQLLPVDGKLGYLTSNILFGVFHTFELYLKYESGLIPMTTIFFGVFLMVLLGFAWTWVKKNFGLMGSTGSHFAWNCFVSGVLVKIFGG